MTQLTNEEILQKAINKAIKNGWKLTNMNMYPWKAYSNYVEIAYPEGYVSVHCFELIYSHDFARAFFGEDNMKEDEDIEVPCEYTDNDPAIWHKAIFIGERWKYHLQQMIISEDPIKYLSEFI